VKEDVQAYWNQWENIVKNEVVAWRNYHLYWLKQAQDRNIPIYFFRYEDMLGSTFFIMKELFAFILEMKRVEGTFIGHLIDENIARGKEVGALQEPKID